MHSEKGIHLLAYVQALIPLYIYSCNWPCFDSITRLHKRLSAHKMSHLSVSWFTMITDAVYSGSNSLLINTSDLLILRFVLHSKSPPFIDFVLALLYKMCNERCKRRTKIIQVYPSIEHYLGDVLIESIERIQ